MPYYLLISILASFDFDFSREGTPVSYTMPAEMKEYLLQEGKAVISLWSPVHSNGEYVTRFMVFTLTCTPFSILFGWKIKRYRKLFGTKIL